MALVGGAISGAWESRDLGLVLAKVLCIALTFRGYRLFVAADRRLGEGTLWRTFWGRE